MFESDRTSGQQQIFRGYFDVYPSAASTSTYSASDLPRAFHHIVNRTPFHRLSSRLQRVTNEITGGFHLRQRVKLFPCQASGVSTSPLILKNPISRVKMRHASVVQHRPF